MSSRKVTACPPYHSCHSESPRSCQRSPKTAVELPHTSGHSKRNAGRREQSWATVSSTSQVPTTRPGSGPRSVSVNRHCTPAPPAQTQLRRTGTTQERKPERGESLHSFENANRLTDYGNHKQNIVDAEKQQKPFRSSHNNETFVTLVNTKNNCCVNALLQTLFIIPEYSNLLLNGQRKDLLIKNKNHILYHLGKVFQHLQNKTERTVSPDKFIKFLRSNHINVGSQMDAEELFRSLCNLLEDQLKKTPCSNFVNELHVLTTEEYGICLKCQNEFQQIGHMLTIPLSLCEPSSGRHYKNVMNSLNGFFELQNLDDENKCYCDQCGEKTATQHGYRVRSWPEILCLQLKRFDFVASLRKKFINTSMEFTESISLNNCEKELHNLKNIPQYKLISVIVHEDLISFGHYYVYIKDIEKRKWHCFNDEHVTEKWRSLSSFLQEDGSITSVIQNLLSSSLGSIPFFVL
ncbi:ubl carboxyl-terminal hydrolase 18-like isoform X2 [Hemiscyllium ocellatum]|uniref:ubl carboxyl-terminal hydrolase 18-like isoform X2 n=1 Tax=Hemiscyllium ocellatum TaxID=170820 RepID=UPI0029668DCA|nr:ubl carboxyl-terminal hydrolase 18-like isoform X2 [Hemiscyllium ocellatum]